MRFSTITLSQVHKEQPFSIPMPVRNCLLADYGVQIWLIAHLCKSCDVIHSHSVVRVQHCDLPPRADGQPVLQVLCGVELKGVQN